MNAYSEGDVIEYKVDYTHLSDDVVRYHGRVQKVTGHGKMTTYEVVRHNGALTGNQTVDKLGPRDIVGLAKSDRDRWVNDFVH